MNQAVHKTLEHEKSYQEQYRKHNDRLTVFDEPVEIPAKRAPRQRNPEGNGKIPEKRDKEAKS